MNAAPSPIIQTLALDGPWPGVDPFLFTAHHVDRYPRGNEQMAPEADLAGRTLGQDFSGTDGWSMYHGQTVPGFPAHPHRGFETVTLVEEGLVDHTDSAGAEARYGQGDAQWLTAGAGISHCEMFPLVNQNQPNPLHLFQIWLNLPPEDKTADPYFTILWAEETPIVTVTDAAGRTGRVKVIAGRFDGQEAPPPPPASWAARPDTEVAIWHIELDAEAELTLPAADLPVTRTLYVYDGTLEVAKQHLTNAAAVVEATEPLPIRAGTAPVRLLLLQGRPIGAPVVQNGPFVDNTREGLAAAFNDYRAGKFGRWESPVHDPVHAREQPRFARHADGTWRTPPQ
ncbi:MAG: pirin family protein [Propioniciclava sp.]